MTVTEYQAYSQPASIVSMALSSTVIITVMFFPSMIQHKVFMEIIIALLCCDIFGNWPYALGYYPSTNTILCKFSGFCNLFFFPCTWLYTVALAVNLYGLVFYRKAILIRYKLHMSVLGFPLIITLCLLSTNQYGKPDSGAVVCSMGGSILDRKLWHDTTYYGLLLICLACMLVLLGHLRYLEYTMSPLVGLQTYRTARKYLVLYPIILGVCWLPHTIFGYIKNGGYVTDTLVPIFDVFKIMHGGLVAITFFINSREARLRWALFFRFYFGKFMRPAGGDQPLAYLGDSEVLSIVIEDDLASDEQLSERLRQETLSSEYCARKAMNSDFSDTGSVGFTITPCSSVKSMVSITSRDSVNVVRVPHPALGDPSQSSHL